MKDTKNIVGKTLLGVKKVGKAISKSAVEVGGTISEVASDISADIKKSAKVSMLKAELEQGYTKLGKCVFDEGIVTCADGNIYENENVTAIMNELYAIQEQIDVLEAELATEPVELASDIEVTVEEVETVEVEGSDESVEPTDETPAETEEKAE